MTGPGTCSHCGTLLYSEWWDEAASGYECHRCGTVKPGLAPPGGSPHIVIGLWLAVVVLLAADLAGALVVFLLSPDFPWRMAALVALGAVVLSSMVFVIATVVVAVISLRQRRASRGA